MNAHHPPPVAGKLHISPRWWGWAWCVIGSLLPLLFLAAVTARYYYRYLFADDWPFVNLLDKAYAGTLTFSDLWASYQNHRLLFMYLVMIPIDYLTHWDERYIVALNIVMACGIFVVTAHAFRRSARLLGDDHAYRYVPLFALIVFSLNQWYNWPHGWEVGHFLTVLAASSGIVVLSHADAGARRLAVSMALGVVASYSDAAGMAYWGAGLAVLLLPLLWGRPVRWGYVLLWSVMAAIVFMLFIHGLEEGPGMARSLTKWLASIPYYVGANVTLFRLRAAFPAGVCGLVFAAAAHYVLWRGRRVPVEALAPFTGFIAYGLGVGVLIAIGRAEEGIRTIGNSRFCTHSNLFWLGVVFLLYTMTRNTVGATGTLPARPGWRRFGHGGLAAMALLSVLCTRQGYYDLDAQYTFYMPIAKRIVVEDLPELPPRLQYLYGNTRREELRILRERRLFMFRPSEIAFWKTWSGGSAATRSGEPGTMR